MEIKYLIGLDLGHGETTASFYDLTNSKPTAKVLQLLDGKRKTVFSAFYKENGKYKIANSEQDFAKKGISAYFKSKIEQPHPNNDNVRLKEFFNLVIESLLKSNGNLKYNKETREKNFLLYLACPSGWSEENVTAPKEYKKFLQTEIPIEWVIKESDAAFFCFYDEHSNSKKKTLVIDLGSSTIDFTAYGEGRIIDSWGEPDGAWQVERAILDYYLSTDKEYIENYRAFLDHWKGTPPMDIRISFELLFRAAKERFYENNDNYFAVTLLKKTYFEGREDIKGNLIECTIDKWQIDRQLKSYKADIERDFLNAKERLRNRDFIPELVVISGGASRMPFVKEFAEKVFGVNESDETLEKDTSPEHVVSHGIAKYAYTMHMIEEDIKRLYANFSQWADNNLRHIFHNALEKAMDKAEEEVLKDELIRRFVNSTSEGSAFKHLYAIMEDAVLNLTKRHFRTIDEKLNKSLREAMNSELSPKISSIVRQRYAKDVQPNIFFTIDFKDFIRTIPVTLEGSEIADLGYTGYFYFKDRDMDRDITVRQEGVRQILSLYREKFGTFNLTLSDETHNTYMSEIKESVYKKIREIVFEEYGLFELTR